MNHTRRFGQFLEFTRPQFPFHMLEDPTAANHCGHADTYISKAIGPDLEGTHRKNLPLIQDYRVNQSGNARANSPACAPFQANNLGATLTSPVENLNPGSRREIRMFLQRKPVASCGRPDRHHGVPMLSQHQSFDLGWRGLDSVGDERAETGRIQKRSKTDDLPWRKTAMLNCKIGENVYGIGNHQEDCVVAKPRVFQVLNDGRKE